VIQIRSLGALQSLALDGMWLGTVLGLLVQLLSVCVCSDANRTALAPLLLPTNVLLALLQSSQPEVVVIAKMLISIL
jgi:hypothetical protein